MSRVMFVGDSHLDAVRGERLKAFEAAVGRRVDNRAVGGSGVHDVPDQTASAPTDIAVTVLSLGTNDSAPWKEISFETFASTIPALVATLPGRVVYLAPPGVDESVLGPDDPTMAGVARYTDAARAAVAAHGGTTLETQQVLAGLGTSAFVEDGVHLTDVAYSLLLKALAEELGPAPH